MKIDKSLAPNTKMMERLELSGKNCKCPISNYRQLKYNNQKFRNSYGGPNSKIEEMISQ
jgi:hypothetical protein